MTSSSIAYYTAQSVMTDPRDQAGLYADLPAALPALLRVVQGLLLTSAEAELYGVALTTIQRREVNIRTVQEMLQRIHALDARPLSVERAPAERLTATDRDHAVLLTSMLRAQGIPARVRVGFATYLQAHSLAANASAAAVLYPDHWVAQVWSDARQRWQWVDAQLDALQVAQFAVDFVPYDLPEGKFIPAGVAWSDCRQNRAKSRSFGHNLKLRGWPYLRRVLTQELVTLNKVEVLPSDVWWDIAAKDDDTLTPDEKAILDYAATVTGEPDEYFEDLLIAFEADERFAGPTRSKLTTLGLTQTAEPTPVPPPAVAPRAETPAAAPAQPQRAEKTPYVDAPPAARVASAPELQPSDRERLLRFKSQPAALPSEDVNAPRRNGKAADARAFSADSVAGASDPDHIVVRGAAMHNLRHVNIRIPRNKMVVMTGVSGSGKSSLAFDTLYAEGQRRYVESLSAYVRRYLDQMDKPKVDYIGGLSPAISIEQKSVSKNPRSTVGTVTEIVDYLRVLYSRAGTPHCPQCGRAIEPISPQSAADALLRLPPGTRYQVIAPIARHKKGDYLPQLEAARRDGYTRARIDGEAVDLTGKLPKLLKSQPHTVEIIVDRLIAPDAAQDDAQTVHEYAVRVMDSVETALRSAKGLVMIDLFDGDPLLLSESAYCPHCEVSLPPLTAALFSFNAPAGMCPACNGMGTKMEVDPALIVEHPELSLMEGASRWYGNLRKKKGWQFNHLQVLADHYGVDLNLAWKDLPQSFRDVVLYGSDEEIHFKYTNKEGTFSAENVGRERGIVYNVNRLFRQTSSEGTRRWYMSFMSQQPCPACGGTRLCAEARSVTVGGRTFPEVADLTIEDAHAWVVALSEGELARRMSAEQLEIVGEVLKELRSRLQFLLNVGLHYLSLSRPAPTLSGGEGQRIRLASQLGCGLVGVLYILDEPSIGLHPRDQHSLLQTLLRLRDMGNTVLVVEHDEETMRAADWLIDLGPGAGVNGGMIVSAGTPQQVCDDPNSLTGAYLSGRARVHRPQPAGAADAFGRRAPRGWLTLRGARLFNLRDVTARFPLGTVTVVTGVSGSGKSSLVADTLYPALARQLMGAQTSPGPYERLDGLEQLDKVINITQEPIGRTPRSNPATYVGVFDEIRRVFAATPEAKARGYAFNRFSFNVKGGRCEACQGHGLKRIEMHFLPDVWVQCQECKGARYNRHTLEITYKGKNIAQALEMDVQEALEFFGAHPKITRILQTLHDVGLDYLKLGQSATTLSGGEAQRVKLASELCRVATGDTIYILDEPTTGLHFADVQRLLDVLHRLADAGNTVVVIEHNLDVIRTADWLIDLGPEGGAGGGQIIAEGTPEQLAVLDAGYTAKFLSVAVA